MTTSPQGSIRLGCTKAEAKGQPRSHLFHLEETRPVDRLDNAAGPDCPVDLDGSLPIAAEHQVPGLVGRGIEPVAGEGFDQPGQVLLGDKAVDRQEVGTLGGDLGERRSSVGQPRRGRRRPRCRPRCSRGRSSTGPSRA